MATDQETQSGKTSREHRHAGPKTGVGIKTRRLDPLSAWSIMAFVVLALLWIAFRAFPEPDPRWFRRVSRFSAYLATLAILVPYIHIARRSFRYRYWGKMANWMRWHITAGYSGFGLAIIHSRARTNNELTFAIQVVLWTVVISGIVGFYGQKLVYRLLALLVREELGLERLEPERQRLMERGMELVAEMSTSTRRKSIDGFLNQVFLTSLCPPLASWSWLFSRRALEPIPKNHYLRVRGMCSPTQQAILDELWDLVETRRRMDIEYWMHRLGHVWLLVHGPASWTLLFLVVLHIWLSVQYGGF